jgi:citrate lyase subunit beta/citryl-CoA lyase
VDPANRIFGPSEAELEDARAVIEAFSRPENAARGVLSLNGRMIERMHIEVAQRALDMAAQIEARK